MPTVGLGKKPGQFEKKYYAPLQHEWCELPHQVRTFIKVTFNMPQTGRVNVVDNHLLCDGTSPLDFQVLTFKTMKAFTKSMRATLDELYEDTINKVTELLTKGEKPIPLTTQNEKKTNN